MNTYYAPTPQPTDGSWFARQLVNAGLPPQEAADLCNKVGADLWFSVSYSATDQCITSLFTMLGQRLTHGRKFYVEYSNECWNYGYPGYAYCDSNSRLAGIGHFDWYAKRAAQVHNLAQAALAALGRGGDLVRVFGAQGAWAGNSTQAIVNYAVANNLKIDAIAVAVYIENAPTPFVGPGGGESSLAATYDLCNTDQLMDLGELFIQFGGCEHFMTDHYSILAPHYPNAKVVCYEGGPELGLPGTALAWGSPPWVVREHIWARHPRMRGIMLYFLQLLQNNGCTLFNDFQVASVDEFAGGYNWNCYYTWNMKAGMGDGSDKLFDNRLNFEDYAHLVSVVGGAINHWNSLVH
jgi:hypothetical protein